MANLYSQGNYLVRFFDRYGSRCGDDLQATHFIQAERIGRDVKDDECQVNSFVILRVLFNSLDSKEIS